MIRHVAGLRPFRPSGFNVSIDSVGPKPIIHNYGHGGGGVSLSWGTAHLALQYALATPDRDVAVIGCGAVGLATARLLQDHGFTVTIYARDLPPDTTSNTAGASWAPVTIVDEERRTSAFDNQFVRASRFAFRYFQNLVGPRYGVSWRETYLLSETTRTGPTSVNALIADLRPRIVPLTPGDHPFGSLHAARTLTMHIEPAIYLQALLSDYRVAGGRVVVRELVDAQSARALPHPLIVNCSGLGAAALFNDAEMLPIKGQLTVLAPQREVDYITVGPGDLYMMPRQDGIILGGTHERGEWSLEPNPAEISRIVHGHRRLFGSMP
ncbi:MAG: FAD-binding oxidoreductase [Gemmatimonadota bacterium]|nr:FAD-binding oxidoreductase [Gemmatimonadota bacterium]